MISLKPFTVDPGAFSQTPFIASYGNLLLFGDHGALEAPRLPPYGLWRGWRGSFGEAPAKPA
jgi:hypothetical protein